MTTNQELLGSHARLISAQKDTISAAGCIETEEYKQAWREFIAEIATYNEASRIRTGDPLDDAAKQMLNAQRAFIKAQIDLLTRNGTFEAE